MNTALKVLGSVVGALFVIVVVTAVATTHPRASQPRVQSTATSMSASGPLTSFSDGSYLVGVDIMAGTYTSPGPPDSPFPWCSWSRSRDDSGSLDSFIAADGGAGPRRFTAMTGEVVRVQGCTFTLVR